MVIGKNDPWTLWNRLVRALERVARGSIREVTITNAYTQLSSVACFSVIFTNTSGKNIKVRRGGSGAAITIPNNSGKEMDVNANADELQICNATDTASITIQYELTGENV